MSELIALPSSKTKSNKKPDTLLSITEKKKKLDINNPYLCTCKNKFHTNKPTEYHFKTVINHEISMLPIVLSHLNQFEGRFF